MGIRIGTMPLGQVEEVDGEWIRTKYVVVGVPLIPLGSIYETGDGNYIPIKMNWVSAFAGFCRFNAGIGWVLLALFGVLAFVRHGDPDPVVGGVCLALALALFAVWCVAMFVVGKPRAHIAEERMLLKQIVGIGVHPSMLKPQELQTLFEKLKGSLAEAGLPIKPKELCKVHLAGEQLPLGMAAAIYGQFAEPGKGWDRVRASVFKKTAEVR